MNDEQLMTGILLFLMLSTLQRNDPRGKRGRKAIRKELKKQIVSSDNVDPEKYHKFIEAAHAILYKVAEGADAEIDVNPGFIFITVQNRYPELLEPYNIKDDHVDNIKKSYMDTANTFVTVKITNRIVQRMHEYLECVRDGVENDDGKCWVNEMKRRIADESV